MVVYIWEDAIVVHSKKHAREIWSLWKDISWLNQKKTSAYTAEKGHGGKV